jgi:hypothetical protein
MVRKRTRGKREQMKTYTVIYRTGGKENFRWNRTLAYQTYAVAMRAALELSRAGYVGLIHETAKLDAIGLPETFEPGDDLRESAS